MPPTTLCSVIMASTNESFIGNQSPDQNQLKDLLFLTAPLRPEPMPKAKYLDRRKPDREVK